MCQLISSICIMLILMLIVIIINIIICGSLSPLHGASSGCGWRNGLQLWRLAANVLNKQPRTNDKGWSSSWMVGRGDNNSSP
jgi:hypothetical protein